jgi:molybdate transport system ATP-binding protein
MIKLAGVCLELGQFALKQVSLEVEKGDYFMLVGPTGSGKTVMLESIAGLHKIDKGQIWLDGILVNDLEPEKRGAIIVYQDCALFPHMSVAENIVFGLRVRGKSAVEIRAEQKWIVDLLDLGALLSRQPATLSGGEKQKVSLARSLVVRPRLLLLDEPLSALDWQIKEDLQTELKRLHQLLGITVIHVTHDFEEALALGGHMAVMERGQIRQTGTPREIFSRPGSEFVAHFSRRSPPVNF